MLHLTNERSGTWKARFNKKYWKVRQENDVTSSISEIEPGLFIGNSRTSYDSATLRNNNIIAIVTIDNGRFCQQSSGDEGPVVPIDHHMLVPALDSSTQDLLVHMNETCDFIDRMFLTVKPPPSRLSQQDPEKRI